MITDDELDRLLAALADDLRASGELALALLGENEDDEVEMPPMLAEDEAAFQRFMRKLRSRSPLRHPALGKRVQAFRAGESDVTFALRYGISVEDLWYVEDTAEEVDDDDLNESARALSFSTGVPPLKLLRLLKAIRAHVTNRDASPVLMLARRKAPADE